MKPRRIVSEEIVGILDAVVSREITDEILAYYLWRPELRQIKNIEYSCAIHYWERSIRYIGGITHTYKVRDKRVHESSLTSGVYSYVTYHNGVVEHDAEFRRIMRRFWNGTLEAFGF
nr:hypothetical protein K-LCC10_0010 [Kaumoebavirus]